MKEFFKSLPTLVKETAAEWQADNSMRLAAALAYYTAFSLAPLVLAAISIAGLIFGADAASGRIHEELKSVLGSSVAEAVQQLVTAAGKPGTGIISTILAFALALFGASGVFGELKDSLNLIWGVTAEASGGIWGWIRGRFLSIGMVMGVCFLLLVSMVTGSLLSKMGDTGLLPGVAASIAMQIGHQLLSLAVITVLFSAMFKYLPATKIQWRDVWVGGFVTAILFSLGKYGLEQYVARAAPASSFGAASALALLLVWVYYSAQIFFFGAEFAEVYSRRYGSRAHEPAPLETKAAEAVSLKENTLASPPAQPAPAPTLVSTVLTASALVAFTWLMEKKSGTPK